MIAAAAEALSINVEIDELQRAASRTIARVTGAEAGCVTSSCSSGLAITSRVEAAQASHYGLAKVLAETLTVHATPVAHRVRVDISASSLTARQFANALREGDPPVWIRDAEDRQLVLDLRALKTEDAPPLARRIAELIGTSEPPRADVPFHDFYWSEERLLKWSD